MSSGVLSAQEERIAKGEGGLLTTEEARVKRPRIGRMLQGIRASAPRIEIDRARILTESFKETEDLPQVIRWARFLERLGKEFPVYIGKDEMIVGRCGPSGRYSIQYPELQARWASDLKGAKNEDHWEGSLSEESLKVLNEEIIPYWNGKTLYESYIKALPEDALRVLTARGDVYAPSMAVRCASAANSTNAWVHDFQKVLKRGFNGLKREAQERLSSIDIYDPDNNYDKMHFYKAVIIVCDAIATFANRYAELARSMAEKESSEQRKRELLEIAGICQQVPANPARNFREAVQSLWFVLLFSRLDQVEPSHSANGRIDQYLYPYYKKDKDEGRITDDDVLELLQCLWLNMAQSVKATLGSSAIVYSPGHPHFEHTTIGGQTPDGEDATNELSYLILKSKKEFPLDYPDLSVRIHSRTPQPFLLKVCELIKEGTGYPKLMNDEDIIPQYMAWGATLGEARDYCGAGCTEVRILNKETYFSQTVHVSLGAALEFALNDGKSRLTGEQIGIKTGDPRRFKSYEDVWNAFRLQLDHLMKYAFIAHYISDIVRAKTLVAPMISCMHDLCMEQGLDIHQGQGKFKGDISMGWISNVGFGTAIDSLAAIKKLVYDDKVVAMGDMLEALDTDFKGKEVLRQMCVNAPKYGNCDPYADSIGREIDCLLVSAADRCTNVWGGYDRIIYVPVTLQVTLGKVLGATPNGRRAKEAMSEGISPSQGCDVKGPTATLLSIAKTKNGSAARRGGRLLNMKLTPQAVAGEEGTANLASFIRTWCDMKFWHIQFNIVNRETLIEAQKHPDKYRNLLVRMAGYSVFFVDLSPSLQNEIISRTEHGSV